MNEENLKLIQQLCEMDESVGLETKRVSSTVVKKALVAISAFANTNGGILILGMEDFDKAQGEDRLLGIEENKEAIDELKRKVDTQLSPSITGIQWKELSYQKGSGQQVTLLAVQVPKSTLVHSVIDSGTWKRMERSNRQMTADEINELSYLRGMISADSEVVDVDLDLLETSYWKAYSKARGLATGDIEDRMRRVGLAKSANGSVKPLRAAVLLFAEDPSGLLARKSTVRIFHYSGTTIQYADTPNLLKTPKTIKGPLTQQISDAYEYVINEISTGLTMARSGFETVHRYPVRVIREVITNAVIHRDYHINQDIHICIFDNRIEVKSPGLFIKGITPRNIRTAGSKARNQLISTNIREFPDPPNIDAGEGVRMMFSAMKATGLYPPFYFSTPPISPADTITVWLLNEEQPPIWEQVYDWIEKNGSIANRDLRNIAAVDTLKASRLLRKWVEQGLLLADDSQGKRKTVYRLLESDDTQGSDLLSKVIDNK
jgi:ATP-dependent DNA helicase RecG